MTRNGAISVTTVDRSSVNALSADVCRGLLDAFDEIASEPGVRGGVFPCVGRTFVAGAESFEFGSDAYSEADPNNVCG